MLLHATTILLHVTSCYHILLLLLHMTLHYFVLLLSCYYHGIHISCYDHASIILLSCYDTPIMLWPSYHAMTVLHLFYYHKTSQNTSGCFLLLHVILYFFVLSAFLLRCSMYLMIFPVISDYLHINISLSIIIRLTVTIMWIMTMVSHCHDTHQHDG